MLTSYNKTRISSICQDLTDHWVPSWPPSGMPLGDRSGLKSPAILAWRKVTTAVKVGTCRDLSAASSSPCASLAAYTKPHTANAPTTFSFPWSVSGLVPAQGEPAECPLWNPSNGGLSNISPARIQRREPMKPSLIRNTCVCFGSNEPWRMYRLQRAASAAAATYAVPKWLAALTAMVT